ncbi:MAG: hypothetical protein E7270_07155 [Lachnospiraceae bacterium]|nr:hypothetical protein [Lachnospiraceae bacterium]
MCCFPSCSDGYKMIIPNICSIINKKLEDSMKIEKQITEKTQSTFTKRIGNTTFKVQVHFVENTTDTVEDKILHLLTVTDVPEADVRETTQKNAG